MDKLKDFLRISEAAEHLGVSPNSIIKGYAALRPLLSDLLLMALTHNIIVIA